MRAVVIKKKGNRALALTQDGHYIRLKCNSDTHIGASIEYAPKDIIRNKIMVPITALILCFVMAFSIYAYATPAAYVTVDINPGIELALNRFQMVISSTALNDKAKAVLSEIKTRHRHLDNALLSILKNAEEHGYIINDENSSILLTVFTSNQGFGEKISQKLSDMQNDMQADHGIQGIMTAASNMLRHEQAKELGISPGKMLLIERIEAEEEIDLSVDDLKDMSIKDIMTIGKAAGAERKNQEKENNANENSNIVPGKQEKDTSPGNNPGLDGPASDKGKDSSQSGGRGN